MNWFGSVRVDRFHPYETGTEPTIFLNILIGLIGFFFMVRFFQLIFFIFSI
jgi:hypothetical protein